MRACRSLVSVARFLDDGVMAGQTKSEIRALLADRGLAPQHRFGQNFLIDLNLMRKVVSVSGAASTDVLLEVGPGTGSLTELLLETGARVLASEIDRGLQELLAQRLAGNPRFSLLRGDALRRKNALNDELIEKLQSTVPESGGVYRLVANLPYSIATPLISELLLLEPAFATLTCTIQKEVGRRLVAGPGDAEYGALSVVAQTLAEIELVGDLPPEAFWPQPQVHSVLVHACCRPRTTLPVRDPAFFRTFVRNGFLHPRKKVAKQAAKWPTPLRVEDFERVGVSAADRAGVISVAQWQQLSDLARSAAGSATRPSR